MLSTGSTAPEIEASAREGLKFRLSDFGRKKNVTAIL